MNAIARKLQTVGEVTLLIKDIQLMILFVEMFKTEWLIFFLTSPLSLVVKPLLGTALLLMGALQILRHAKAEKQTPELWIVSLFGVSSIMCSNISIWGGIGAMAAGVKFAAGPWFFLASLVLGLVMQVLLIGTHAYLAAKAPPNSVARVHHTQAIMQNFFLGLQFSACIVTMVFAIFLPVAPPVSAAFAMLTGAIIFAHILWRLIPHTDRIAIKAFFGFAKPEVTHIPLKTEKPLLAAKAPDQEIAFNEDTQHSRAGTFFGPEPYIPANDEIQEYELSAAEI